MTLKVGDMVGGYRISREWTTAGAGNCRWTFATRDGREFFVKEFLRPKRPKDGLPPDIAREKLERCRRFEQRYHRLVKTVRPVVAEGGNIVMPETFFYIGSIYYLVAPRIETTSLPVAEVARLTTKERLTLMRVLTRAISTIHAQGLVHCDLKPNNVLIQKTPAGIHATKLIDFDGSFFAGEPPDQEEMAFDQSYMSPEVLAYSRRGGDTPAAAARLGTAADIFSLGILLHEYWTGRRPAAAGDDYPAEAVAAGRRLNVMMPGLASEAVETVRRMLLLDATARPTAADVGRALEAAVRSEKAAAAPYPEAAAGPLTRSRLLGGLKRPAGAGLTPLRGFGEEPAPPPTPPSAPPSAATSPASADSKKPRLIIGRTTKRER